jgi:hypothetical protein
MVGWPKSLHTVQIYKGRSRAEALWSQVGLNEREGQREKKPMPLKRGNTRVKASNSRAEPT